MLFLTVPITDTGGLAEYAKAIERKMFKELGKKARRNLWEMPSPHLLVCTKAENYLLRNSVHCPSKGEGRSECLFSDCLSKTQVPAKPKGKV